MVDCPLTANACTDALFEIGEVSRQGGDLAEAIKAFQRALAVNPNHAKAWHRLGNAHKALHCLSNSEKAYRHAAVLTPNDPELLRQLGNALKDQGRLEEAVQVYAEALSHGLEDHTAAYAMAYALWELWQFKDSRQYLFRVLALRPDHGPSMLLLGSILKDQGRLREAIVLFERVISLAPDSPGTWTWIGGLWREFGLVDRALSAQRLALALKPSDEYALHAFGNLQVHFGRPDAAIAAYRRGLAVRGDYFELQAGMGIARIHLGNVESGLTSYFDAIGLPPECRSDCRRPAAPRDTGVTVATSLMGKRIEDQQRAIASWRSLGYEVISVNAPAEIAELRNVFPDVAFSSARRTAEDRCRRPLVPLDEMMDALRRCGTPICAIVNSDIVLSAPIGVGAELARYARGALVFGNRLNIESHGDRDGWIYDGGYDYFFFDRAFLDLFGDGGMVVGAPWWDYWVPLAAAVAGVPLRIPRDLTALHRLHEIGYSRALHQHFAGAFISAMGRLIDRLPPDCGAGPCGPVVRALQALDAARQSGAWDISGTTPPVLGRLVVDTINRVAQAVTLASGSASHVFVDTAERRV